MLKQQATILRRIAIALDIVALVCAIMLAFELRRAAGEVAEFNNYVWLLFFAIPCWIVLSTHYKLYESLRLRTYSSIVWALVKVHAIGGMLLASVIFILNSHSYSRPLFAQFLLVSFLLTSAFKILVKLLLSNIRRKGYNIRNILIIGTGQNALKMCELINHHHEWGLNILGLVAVTNSCPAVDNKLCPVIGSISQLIDICKERIADEVVFALEKDEPCEMGKLFQELQDLGLTVRVVFDYLTPRSSKTDISLFHNEIPILTYTSICLSSNQLMAKRCLDFVGALVGLTFAALMFPFIVLAIKLDSPGPVFFGQPRVRENGRRFICWKYRTMCVDAEAQKQNLMALNEMKGAMFKVKDDPRITRVGRFLRKSSLDEFPQFWNVLRGEMSLVGTRPPTPDEVATYQNWHRKRISIKPGITGLWQVSGRSKVLDFDDVVRLDLIYIETWTIWLDIIILLKTPMVMLSSKGAS